jgi:hypothetical protein
MLIGEFVVNTKICKSCELIKPHSDFYKSINYKDGLQSICKDCSKRKIRKNKTIKTFDIPLNIDSSQPLKTCIQCWVEKPATSDYFSFASRTKDDLKVICRKCEQINNEFSKVNQYIQEIYIDADKILYRCENCGRFLERDRFRSHKAFENNIYTPMCIDCINDYVSSPDNNGFLKKCRICGEIKTATSDNFHIHIHKEGFLRDECKECNNRARNELRKKVKII